MAGSPLIKTELKDEMEKIPDSRNIRLALELTPAELERMRILTERLGILHPDDIIRYCLAQVTWWVLSGPMSTTALQEAARAIGESHNNSSVGNGQQSNQRHAYQ